MSGIVGIINTDGAPADQGLLRRMTAFLTFRGPDAQEVWVGGHVGLGHTMLRTTHEAALERQPASLDGKVWITADARVDGREGLIAELEAEGRGDLEGATDAELILHSYHAWGEECMSHLIGDFSFAIWDAANRKLFCARDHFGLKPFFWAEVGTQLVFSNTLNCVRAHPLVSQRLNPAAVGDFLLFDYNKDTSTTVFADIQRLPPAHTLTWSGGSPRVRRYWQLPLEDEVRYRRPGDYEEHFRHLFQQAVADRLRAPRAGVLMSGGLDSTAIATVAHQLLSARQETFDLRAYTTVFDGIFQDEEGRYARIAAEHLGIPIHLQQCARYGLYERWDEAELRQRPEPTNDYMAIGTIDLLGEVGAQSRVALSGQGGDAVLWPSPSYFVESLKKLRVARALTGVGHYVRGNGRLPQVGFRSTVRGWFAGPPQKPSLPSWLNQEFASTLDLQGRLERAANGGAAPHPTRPGAYKILASPYWAFLFESYEPGITFFGGEVRYPFFDVRLVRFLLSVPPIPWCVDKWLLRLSMRGRLPEAIRLRPKSPILAPEFYEHRRRQATKWTERFFYPSKNLGEYATVHKLPLLDGSETGDEVHSVLRLCSFNYWLRNLEKWPVTLNTEDSHGSQI